MVPYDPILHSQLLNSSQFGAVPRCDAVMLTIINQLQYEICVVEIKPMIVETHQRAIVTVTMMLLDPMIITVIEKQQISYDSNVKYVVAALLSQSAC